MSKRAHDVMADVVVIGGGHNGLACAAALGKAGRKVLVLEKRDVLGGLCAPITFGEGKYTAPGLLHDEGNLRPAIADALGLVGRGEGSLSFHDEPEPVFVPASSGKGLLLRDSLAAMREELGAHSPNDVKAWERFHAFMQKTGKLIRRVVDEPLPPLSGEESIGALWGALGKAVSLRLLGQTEMYELLRVISMGVGDWLNEQFESDALKVALAGRALLGNFAGPVSPGTAFNLLVAQATRAKTVKGGPASLVGSLVKACERFGVELRTGAAVDGLIVEEGAVLGVKVGGEEIRARSVMATCDPKHILLDLFPVEELPLKLGVEIGEFRGRGVTAKVHLGLKREVSFAARPDAPITRARIAEDLRAIEKAFDGAKYGDLPKVPYLDVLLPTAEGGAVAPDGHSVVSVLVHAVPQVIDGGWNDAHKSTLADTVVGILDKHLPGLSDAVAAREVLAPPDIASRYGMHGGNIFHGEHTLDQIVMRPGFRLSGYKTPISGLYFGGAGTYPGGGMTAVPGVLAARRLLKG